MRATKAPACQRRSGSEGQGDWRRSKSYRREDEITAAPTLDGDNGRHEKSAKQPSEAGTDKRHAKSRAALPVERSEQNARQCDRRAADAEEGHDRHDRPDSNSDGVVAARMA